MTFDTAAFLTDNYPTPAHVIGALDTFGCQLPTEHAVRKWFSRAQVPSPYLPLLIEIQMRGNSDFRLASYIRERRS
jgi:hypothetical protein